MVYGKGWGDRELLPPLPSMLAAPSWPPPPHGVGRGGRREEREWPPQSRPATESEMVRLRRQLAFKKPEAHTNELSYEEKIDWHYFFKSKTFKSDFNFSFCRWLFLKMFNMTIHTWKDSCRIAETNLKQSANSVVQLRSVYGARENVCLFFVAQ